MDSDTNTMILNEQITRLQNEVSALTSLVQEMQPRIKVLEALEWSGVDNWEGYDIAMELLDARSMKENNE